MVCLAVIMPFLSSCAAYWVSGVAPDGSRFRGWALVANNSEQVQLNVTRNPDGSFDVTFGKEKTDGSDVAGAVVEGAVEALTRP